MPYQETRYYSPTGEEITQAEWHQLMYGYPLGGMQELGSYDKLAETVQTKGVNTPEWTTQISNSTQVITRYEGEGHAWISYIHFQGLIRPGVLRGGTVAYAYADNADRAKHNHEWIVDWIEAEKTRSATAAEHEQLPADDFPTHNKVLNAYLKRLADKYGITPQEAYERMLRGGEP